jgi:cell fate regulator YaaT (PSP1 superfamily)
MGTARDYAWPMGLICAVTFTDRGRLYYADPGALTPAVGDYVLYPTTEGPEVAQVMWAPQWTPEEISGLPQLAGLAGPEHIAALASGRKKRAEARVAARRLIRAHGLPMKIVGVDHVLADNRTVIYFSAPHRVDFRSLVRDLGATLRGRVELRQLSARDEARVIGGIGSCGRDLCCSTFLVDFEPVSVRMAKDQDLPLNPLRISGACGRLMCCLKFEHPLYQDFADQAPAIGSCVSTPDGEEATVVGHSVPTESVVLRMNADGRRTTCAMASVCSARKAHDEAYGDGTVGSAQASPSGSVVSATVTDGVPLEDASPLISGAVESSGAASSNVVAASPALDGIAGASLIVGDTVADGIVSASAVSDSVVSGPVGSDSIVSGSVVSGSVGSGTVGSDSVVSARTIGDDTIAGLTTQYPAF